MADVTNELMFEALRSHQHRTINLETLVIEQSHALSALRGHASSIQTDTNNIYGVLSRLDQRLDRIERGLERRELAEAQHPFEPHP